jgi:DNA-directed RNA polymerase specialized sigma subunit
MRSKLIHFSDLNSDKICFEKSLMDGETNSENRQKVLKILMNVIENDLTDRQRHCVFEYYFNGKKMKTIASELGITPPVVTRHIQMGAAKVYKIAKYYM